MTKGLWKGGDIRVYKIKVTIWEKVPCDVSLQKSIFFFNPESTRVSVNQIDRTFIYTHLFKILTHILDTGGGI